MDDSPTAIMVARFSSEKDFESLLRAASIVLKRFPRFRLELVGDGPLKNSSQETAATLGIADAVHFMGNRYDVPARLASACFFVLSTNTEGLSISLLEGMAAGLPVVATAVGGNPEVVVEGETGFLVPRSSPETLADRILWLLDHPDRAKAMGASSRQRVRDAFDVRATVRAYEKLYLQLAGRGGQLPAAGSA
jgi:glycosyltransferase involved in cell wall biosynthesis